MRRWRTTKHENAVLPTGAKTICISAAAPGGSPMRVAYENTDKTRTIGCLGEAHTLQLIEKCGAPKGTILELSSAISCRSCHKSTRLLDSVFECPNRRCNDAYARADFRIVANREL
jgi:hypothetical protein